MCEETSLSLTWGRGRNDCPDVPVKVKSVSFKGGRRWRHCRWRVQNRPTRELSWNTRTRRRAPPFINTAQQQEASSARPARNVLHRSALFISCQSFFLSDKSTWKHNNTNVVRNHLTGPRLNCLFLIPLALKKKKRKISQSITVSPQKQQG